MKREILNIIKLDVSDHSNSDKYILKECEQELGFAYIYHGVKNNNIYVFINQVNRSNGYGTFLFNEMINIIKTSKLAHLTFDIEKSNFSANSIIAKFGGKILSEDGKKHWLLKL